MSENDPQMSSAFGQQQEAEQQTREQELAQRTEYEAMRTAWRRESDAEYAESLDPRDVRHKASKLVEVWLKRWYESSAIPSQWLVENAVTTAESRIRRIKDSLPTAEVSPTVAEKEAGLVEGVYWMPVPKEYLLTPGVQRVEDWLTEDGDTEDVWAIEVEGGRLEKLGLYGDNSSLIESLPDGFQKSVRKEILIGHQTTHEEAIDNREKLAAEIEQQTKALEAWSTLFAKVSEQESFGNDEGNYMFREFTRIGKVMVRARMYETVLNLPPTREGFAPMGEKIQEAHEAWRDITEGRAIASVKIPDPTPRDPHNVTEATIRLPNPFANIRNQGLLDVCMQYVEDRVRQNKPADEQVDMTDGMLQAEEYDNQTAARGALLLLDHWDEDATAALDVFTQEGGVRDAIFEVAYVDSAKVIYTTPRRLKELYGGVLRKDREPPEDDPDKDMLRLHPRKAGSPISILMVPQLSSHLMDVTTIDVVAENRSYLEAKRKDEQEGGNRYEQAWLKKQEELKKQGKSYVKPRDIVKVTIDQRAYGTRDTNDDRVVTELPGGRKQSEVRIAKNSGSVSSDEVWVYEVTGLGDKYIWDSVQMMIKAVEADGTERNVVFDPANADMEAAIGVAGMTNAQISERDDQQPRLIFGSGTYAYEVPKGLLEMYALDAVYGEFTRIDFMKQFEEYAGDIELQKLKGLNKKIDGALGLLAKRYQLSRDTQQKLNDLIRVSLCAGVVGAIASENVPNYAKTGNRKDRMAQVGGKKIGLENAQAAARLMAKAMRDSDFVGTSLNSEGEREWGDTKVKQLYYKLIEMRNEAPLSPEDLVEMGYLTQAQWQELKPMYSFLFMD